MPEKPVKRTAAKRKSTSWKEYTPENLELLPDAHKTMCWPCNPKQKKKKGKENASATYIYMYIYVKTRWLFVSFLVDLKKNPLQRVVAGRDDSVKVYYKTGNVTRNTRTTLRKLFSTKRTTCTSNLLILNSVPHDLWNMNTTILFPSVDLVPHMKASSRNKTHPCSLFPR